MEVQEFTDLDFVQPLQQFLRSLGVPREAQRTDGMMEAFAQ